MNLPVVALLLLLGSALAACGGSEPPLEVTELPAPVVVPAVTAALEPRPGLAPLRMMALAAAEGFLPTEELACIGGEGGGVDLRPLLASPHLATPSQQTRVMQCIRDETVLRIFLGGMSPEELACVGSGEELRLLLLTPHLATSGQQTRVVACMNDETVFRFYSGSLTGLERLELETSDCIREGTAGLDLRSVMGAGPGGDEQAVMARSLAAASVVTSCLSDAEFALAATALGMGPRDREVQFCVVEAMGGPGELSAALSVTDGGGVSTLKAAMASCGMQPLRGDPGG